MSKITELRDVRHDQVIERNEPASDTIMERYGIIHTWLTASAKIRHCCMSVTLEISDGATDRRSERQNVRLSLEVRHVLPTMLIPCRGVFANAVVKATLNHPGQLRHDECKELLLYDGQDNEKP